MNDISDLASLLEIKGPLLAIDTETTGTDSEKDRVVQIAYTQINPNGSVERNSTLINPGVPIPDEAFKVHGISNDAVSNSPPFSRIANSLYDRIKSAVAIIGYSASFDLGILKSEFERVGIELDTKSIKVIDAKEIFFKKEPRTLSAAVKFYCGKSLESAHSAQADIDATCEVLLAQLRRYPDIPFGLDELAKYTKNIPDNAVDPDGKLLRLESGDIALGFGKHNGVTLKNAPRSYLGWLLTTDMNSTVKTIIREHLSKN